VNASPEVFHQHRPRLMGIAYRMLGSRADAEDILQEAYLRWLTAAGGELRSAEAWLVTVVTRLSIDRLRLAKKEREHYTGAWIPEPWVAEEAPPERGLERAGDISTAFLLMLERLAPDERAAFLLHEVFEFGYAEIAQMLGKSQDACRQIVHRAKMRVQQDRPRFTVSQEASVRLLERFIAATRAGDREQVMALLADDVTLTSDGGGKAAVISRVLRGPRGVARFQCGIARLFGGRLTHRIAWINGMPGILRYVDGGLDSATSVLTDGVRILDLYIVRNPDKLRLAEPRTR
jgi:RNA polymerase sigma-70 factor (ECF subfamily)